MENSVLRRLTLLSRHFLVPNEANQDVHLSSVSALEGLLNSGSAPVVIGGMVLDIHATPSIPSQPRTTTPGKVTYVTGGVARNIAESMSKLGAKPFMISVIGLDMAGTLLLEHWKYAGLATDGIQQRQDVGTPTVCNVFDAKGELAAAVASVDAIENFLTPEWIQQFRSNISSAPVAMIDANLSPVALEASCMIAAESGIPVWFEPVSVAKSQRITSIVKHVTFTSPNEDELISMANTLSSGAGFSPFQNIDNGGSRGSIEQLFQLLKPAIMLLLEKGVKIVIVTVGLDGVFVCSKGGPNLIKDQKKFNSSSFGRWLHATISASCPSSKFANNKSEKSSHLYVVHFPALPASVVKLTGAGDNLVGGALASICAGLDVMQSVAVGMAAAKAAVEVETNVPSSYSLAAMAEDARMIYSMAKVICDQPFF